VIAVGGVQFSGGATGLGGAGASAGSAPVGGASAPGGSGGSGGVGESGAGGAVPRRVCETVDEDDRLTVTCPDGATVLSVDFASYGTPTGACGNFAASDCHAASSQGVLDTRCLGLATCTVDADNDTFGDPCRGTLKHLYVQVSCGVTGD
jgi:hypothetical protein